MLKKQILLSISNLSATVNNKKILDEIFLSINPGEIHALVGQNGSGKSSLALTIMGHPDYKIVQGAMLFDNQNISSLTAHERARLGLFLSFQQPISIPGLKVLTLLLEIERSCTKVLPSKHYHLKSIEKYLNFLEIDLAWLERNVNEDFSGGEKKKLELLQMMIAKPKLAILDEIDSGMDTKTVDILKKTICQMRDENSYTSFLIISHNIKQMFPIVADVTHTMHDGKIIS